MSTPNLGLNQPDFNERGWHDPLNANFDKLDAALVLLGYPNNSGLWLNSTLYEVGQVVLDPEGTLWDCLVEHTSSATGTFEDDRTLNPSYWVEIRSGFVWRGGWITGKAYRNQDAVTYNGQSYICVEAHTSGVFATDLAAVKWEIFAEKGSGGAGTGDVNGPASAVADNIALFDGATGKLLKDGAKKVTDFAEKTDAVLLGNPTAVTQSPGNNTTRLSTTAFVTAAVTAAINSILGGVAGAFDTLAKLAAGLALKADKSANLSDMASTATSFTNIKQAATTSATGVVELATDAEGTTGTDTTRAVVPSVLKAVLDAFALAHPTADIRQYTANDTWSKPAGKTFTFAFGWGGGGSGGRAGTNDGGGGGGGGGFNFGLWLTSALSATEAVVIGTGGASRTVDETDGAAGTNTTFGATKLIAYGGGFGAGATTFAGGGGGGGGQGGIGANGSGATGNGGNGGLGFLSSAGGTGSVTVNVAGGSSERGGGGGGIGTNSANNSPGGDSVFGGGGGGGGSDLNGTSGKVGGSSLYGAGGGGGESPGDTGGTGGTSRYAGAGGNAQGVSGNATAGAAPGGGGGGSSNGNSGAGARGELWVISI